MYATPGTHQDFVQGSPAPHGRLALVMNTQPVVVLGAESPIGAVVADGLASRGVSVLRLHAPSEAGESIRALVDAAPLSAPAATELASLDAATWETLAETPLRRALHVLQDAHRCLSGSGRIVVLLPTPVTTGAAGLVPWVAAAEGYRSLTKAAARAWQREGITINCVLVPADADGTNVADVVAALIGDEMAAVTGQTIAVDGGIWMTP